MNEESESQAMKRICEENGFGTLVIGKKDGGFLIYVHAGDDDVSGSLITVAMQIMQHKEKKLNENP